jgi:hypothetical protein
MVQSRSFEAGQPVFAKAHEPTAIRIGLWIPLLAWMMALAPIAAASGAARSEVVSDGVEPGPAAPSKSMLAQLVGESRPASAAFQVVVSSTRVDGPKFGLPDRVEQKLAFSGAKCILIQRVWDAGEWLDESGAPGASIDAAPYLTAEDGANILAVSHGTAVVAPDRDAIGGRPIAQRSLALAALRWQPAIGDAVEPCSGDLLSILAAPETLVDEVLELVDGAWCAVVTVVEQGAVVERLWLDRDHGWQPRLQRSFRADGSLVVERRVEEFVLAGPSLWLPTAVDVLVPAIPPLIPEDSRTRLEFCFADPEWPFGFRTNNHANFDEVCALVDSVPALGVPIAAATPGVGAARVAASTGTRCQSPPAPWHPWWGAGLASCGVALVSGGRVLRRNTKG